MKRVLVTGANGFVGKRLCERLSNEYQVIAGCRTHLIKNESVSEYKIVDLNDPSNFDEIVKNIDIIIHCAAVVHQASDMCMDAYIDLNCKSTIKLAECAARANVSRFIFISTVKVYGEHDRFNEPFKMSDIPEPVGSYAYSKLLAEIGLRNIGQEYSMEVVIIRPPLVYGPGVKANFSTLINLIKLKIPLPIGNINNTRSFVYIDNLVDLICCCMTNPKAPGRPWLVSDGQDVSTSELVNILGNLMDINVFVVSINPFLLEIINHIPPLRKMYAKISGSLSVDISETTNTLSWTPLVSLEKGLEQTLR